MANHDLDMTEGEWRVWNIRQREMARQVAENDKRQLREAVSTTQMPQVQRPASGYSRKKRAALAKKGAAIPIRNSAGRIVDGRHPIDSREDVRTAILRHVGDPIDKAHILKHANRTGAAGAIPDDWKETQ